ncbi:IS110 family RNA-guided transposase [Subtercola frigoramans]|uniref:Transposase n=1 Tax=Subtercola frigoramans TaxID=120298 RepID=A0ABS2L730_9MICO|nr:IS110 family transposase [Subtercola frigoramans]MBM7472893.1 transposase [Subtercola frigoramans]
MTATLPAPQPTIIVGVDAHKDTHHAVVLDSTGIRLADRKFSTTELGYRELLSWSTRFGLVDRIGVESTGTYAAGLTRSLRTAGIDVMEVNTPHPHTRSRKGKDDAIDAEAAARKVLAGEAVAIPKDTTGTVESIRLLTVAKSSAVKARTACLVQLQDVLVTAPSDLRERITAATGRGKATQCAALRPDRSNLDDPYQAAKFTLRCLARRVIELEHEIGEIDCALEELVTRTAPTLLSRQGIGVSHAAQFLVTAGQNASRLGSEAAFARLCGVAPVPVSSGKTSRMRLHRGGDRQANRALHLIVVLRLRYDARTITYMERRRAEGLSKKDVMRCLKRFVAREIFNDLKTDLTAT